MNDNHRIINVLWLVDHLGYNGAMHGAGMYYLKTIPNFDKSKINITLCVLRKEDDLTKLFKDKSINIHHLGRGKFDLRTIADIVSLIRNGKVNLMHAHGYGSANFGRLARMIRKTPIIVHAHDDDRKYPLHQKIADRLLAQFTDKAIAVSESVKEASIRKRKIREDKIDVIHNGIPLKEFYTPEKERVQRERARLGVRPDVKVIGTVAKLREEKGTEYLIKAAVKVFGLFPKTVLLIAGDGILRDELENLSRQLGIEEKVIFAGFCQDIPAILSIVDIVAIPSLTEGSPLALMEAMAMEKPIVATNVGGIREIVRNGETGLLVPSKDVEELANNIIFLLKDGDKARHIGMNAKEESKKYDIDVHVKKLEEKYIQVLDPSGNNRVGSFGPESE